MKTIELHAELKQFEGESIGKELIGRIKKTENHTIKTINDKPFRKPGQKLVNVYLNHCYSRPVAVYIEA